ncbi:MAG: EamA family transporter [Candidatus Promineifilaceae bacterium]
MKLKNFLLLVLLASMWGPSFIFIKVAVETIPPITMVLGRVTVGAIVLLTMLRLQGSHLPKWGPTWKHLAVVALIHNAIPFVLFSWGEQYIDSALAAILNGTVPFFTIILAHFFAQDDRITPVKLFGILVGFAGMVFLAIPTFGDGIQSTTFGILAITVAAFLYGVAIVYTRNHLRGLQPLAAPTGQMIIASLYLLPLSLLIDRPYLLPVPSLASIGSVFALGVLGTAAAFTVYYKLMERASASYVSMTTYLIPVFGVILGALVLDEAITWERVVGCGLILVGVMIVNGLVSGVFLARKTTEQSIAT